MEREIDVNREAMSNFFQKYKRTKISIIVFLISNVYYNEYIIIHTLAKAINN